MLQRAVAHRPSPHYPVSPRTRLSSTSFSHSRPPRRSFSIFLQLPFALKHTLVPIPLAEEPPSGLYYTFLFRAWHGGCDAVGKEWEGTRDENAALGRRGGEGEGEREGKGGEELQPPPCSVFRTGASLLLAR